MKKYIIVLALTSILIFFITNLGLAALEQDQIVLRLAIETNPGQARNNSCEHWAKLVNEYTNGGVKIDIYPSAQLGQPNEVMEGLRVGSVDLTVQGTGLVGGIVPSFNIIFLPYRWNNQRQLERFIESDQFKKFMIDPLKEKNIKYITCWERSPRHLMTKSLPVNTPDDLQGFKLRVSATAASFEIWKAIGCNPQVISWGEAYSAIQQGVVNGFEAPMEALNGVSAYEICKKLILTGHVLDEEVVMVAEKTLQKLSPEQQEILFNAAYETRDWTAERVLEEELGYIKYFEEKGVEVIKPNIEAFINKTNDAVKKFTEEIVPGLDQFIISLK